MIHIVILSDEIDIITDVVAFDNLKQAEKLVHELSAKYGKEHVQRVTARLNEVPAFWGIDCMSAAQQSVQPTGGDSAPLQALSTPEVLSIGGADSTPPTIG